MRKLSYCKVSFTSLILSAILVLCGFFIVKNDVFAAVTPLSTPQVVAVQTFATADGTYANGWSWIFYITVPDTETILKMKFGNWASEANTIPVANNIIFFSPQSSNASDEAHAISVAAASTYGNGMSLNTDSDSVLPGRQIQITIKARVPVNSIGGAYSTSYSIESTADTVAPVITMLGTTPITIEAGSTYTDAGATALDDIDGNITSGIVATNTVNATVVGNYSVVYNVSDTAGNAATPVTRVVNVADSSIPVIHLTGANPQTIVYGNPYVELGVTVTDNQVAQITPTIDATAVDTNTVDSYTVTYNAIDGAGNTAVTATRTVNVITRNITVTANPQTIVYGTADPVLTYAITSGSLANTDTFTGTLSRDPGTNIGTYAINQGTLSLNSNYNLTYIPANLVITAMPITMSAIAGIAVPTNTGMPTLTIPETTEYTAIINWNPADSPFRSNVVYTATITITAKTGYDISTVPANFFTVSGAVATNAAGSGTVTAVFPMTSHLYVGSGQTYGTIMAAINAASANDTVHVAAGTYNERLYIAKPVNIIGENKDTTIVRGISLKTDTVSVVSVVSPMSISGLTFDSTNNKFTDGYTIGVWLYNSKNITVEGNNIINFRGSDAKGVYISGTGGADNNIIRANNITTDMTTGSSYGLYIYDSGNNTIGGPSSADGNAIVLSANSTYAMKIINSANAATSNTIQNNTFDGGKRVLEVAGFVGGTTTFTDNIIGQTTAPSSFTLNFYGGSANISNNTFNNAYQPIMFGRAGGSAPMNMVINGNTFNGNVGPTSAIWASSTFNSAVAHQNKFNMPAGQKGVANSMNTNIDATNNWWGSIDPEIVSNKASGNITYSPFCLDSSCLTSGTGEVED